MGLFHCYRCKKDKEETEFGKSQIIKLSSGRICKECDREKANAKLAEKLNDPYRNFFKVIG